MTEMTVKEFCGKMEEKDLRKSLQSLSTTQEIEFPSGNCLHLTR